MALLVDPPQRDNAEERPSAEAACAVETANEPAAPAAMDQELRPPESAADPGVPRLAEPPLTGGRVEALMGRLIRVLSHSRLARPLPAVVLSAVGLGGVAFVGLCATAPAPSVATPPVLLPLTSVARNLGAPHLPDPLADAIMYVSVTLCCLGLGMMLWANSRGWSPDPRKVFAAAAGVVAVVVNITPVGSSDIASYAAYGKLAALGYNPYTSLPSSLPLGPKNPYTGLIPPNPYTELVSPYWQHTPSVYGPVATWAQQFAAWIGGPHAWLTIWVLMIMFGAAFVATGYVLLRTAENPVRAVLLWTANPLLIVELVLGGHLDALLALAAVAAVVMSRRGSRLWHDVAVALLVGVAGAIKVNAVFIAFAIAIPLIHDRLWGRLVRIAAIAGATTFGLYIFSYGLSALKPALSASKLVISPTIWRFVQWCVQNVGGSSAEHAVTSMFGFIWPPLLLLLAWYLYNRLSPDVPTVVAATCALTFAWIVVAPWSLPWYSGVAWVAVALLPRNSLTRWLTLATGALGLLHFNGGHPTNVQIGPMP